jgi:predicted SnoaL-like aldol condensation-catalyzing enzyme
MKVLSIHKGQDTGGQGWRMTQAFRRYAPDWTFHSAYAPNVFFYIAYPQDVIWEKDNVINLWKEADVVHLHNNFATAQIMERATGIRHYNYRTQSGKKAVVHYHGTAFRTNPKPFLHEQRKRKVLGLVSTLDLWLMAPHDTEWLPAPYDLDWLASLRSSHTGKKVRVAHAPTDRGWKSTEAFLAAAARIPEIQVDLIEGVTWKECLARKAKADVYFDQVKLGYGCNSIEAWGMGIPVIAGGQPDTLSEMERRFGELPFYTATEDSIYDALLAMTDPATRDEYGQLGLRHVQRWHDDAKVVEQLKDVYQRAVA